MTLAFFFFFFFFLLIFPFFFFFFFFFFLSLPTTDAICERCFELCKESNFYGISNKADLNEVLHV